MAKVKITGHASGTGVITVTAPNTSTDRTITLPDGDVTLGAATPSIVDGGNATAITINATENVGVGVVPEAWNSVYDAIQVGNTASIAGYSGGDIDRAWVTANGYVNTANGSWQYINTDTASQHEQRDGTHKFQVAASGSADATITWNTALTITNDGRGLSQFTAKAWVNFNGENTVAIRDSHNVSSITDNGTGDYTVNFSNNMANANYAFSGGAGSGSNGMLIVSQPFEVTPPAVGSCRFNTPYVHGSVADCIIGCVTFFGD